MTDIDKLKNDIKNGIYDDKFKDIYVDESRLSYQKDRYLSALDEYNEIFKHDEAEVYSAPGRTEVGGNHTDHQHGEVLAASINNDAIAVVCKRDDGKINVLSKGYDMISLSTDDLDKNEAEEGTTVALIKGVVYDLEKKGYKAGGFDAYVTSDVLSGSGLSSSAAFETLIGTIISGLYNEEKISAVEIAKTGQFAERDYFGKPCGLMDQMACSVGSLCHIDFADEKNPVVEKVDFDLEAAGYDLCITDTKGSHADLTDEYAAVPKEMKEAAKVFEKEFLVEVDRDELIRGLNEIRAKAGDRAALRAIHFITENDRVKDETDALKNKDFPAFLKAFKASGDSSYKYLQNVYTSKDVHHQNVSVALALSEMVLGEEGGVARVHGGGFAGTIQAFVRKENTETYREAMDSLFGEGACEILSIRKYGGIRVL